MPTKEELNKIDQISFWKERLEEANKTGLIFNSVYQTSKVNWDEIWEQHQKIIKKVIPMNATILDVGCGYGRCSILFNPANYLGIDFSPDFIKEAKDIYPDFKFKVADCLNLPFEDKEFDWVLCMSFRHMIIHYLGDDTWSKMENEIKRVAKNVLVLEYTAPLTYELL